MTQRRACVLLLAVALAAWMAVAARAADDVLTIVPDDALALGVVHHLAETDAKIQKAAQVAGTSVPGILDQVKASTGISKGLDEKGTAATIVMPGEDSKSQPQVVVAVPVTNYDQFVEQLKPQKKAGERIGEVEILGNTFLVANRGSYALLAESKHRKALEKVLDSKKSVAGQLGGLEPWVAKNDGAVVLTTAGLKVVAVQAQEGLKNLRDMMGQLPAEANPAQVVAMFDIYERILQAAEKEVSVLALGIRADQGAVYVDARARFTGDGKVSKALADVKPAEGNLLAGLPGGTFVFAGGGVFPGSLMEGLLSFSATMMKQNSKMYGLSPEQVDKLMEISRQSVKQMQSMGMEMKIGKRSDPIYGNISGTMRVANAQQYLADYEKQMAATNELLKEAKEGLMKPSTVKKVEIAGKPGLEVEITIPVPKQEVEIPNFDQIMEKLLGPGGKATMHLVAADEHNVLFGYNTPKEVLAKTIAGLQDPKAGLAADADVAKTAALLAPGSQWVGYLSPRGVLGFVIKTISAFSPEDVGKLPEFPKTPPVGVAMKAGPGEVGLEVVVPNAVIEAIGKYSTRIQEQGNPQVP
jgi:hypothetical protein